MRRKIISVFLLVLLFSPGFASQKKAEQIIEKVTLAFFKISDAAADIALDYNLHLLGCSGLRRFTGKLYYKRPDKIKIVLFNGPTYFAKGNRIRKIDKHGKKFYVRFVNAPDFSVGFQPGLITHNFYLKVLKENKNEIIIEGLPKPGVLKNVTKVIFHIDPKAQLLRKFDIILVNKRLNGEIEFDYEKINGLWAPVGFHGTSAIEVYGGFLVGLGLNLKGKNFKINTGLPDKLFDPCF